MRSIVLLELCVLFDRVITCLAGSGGPVIASFGGLATLVTGLRELDTLQKMKYFYSELKKEFQFFFKI